LKGAASSPAGLAFPLAIAIVALPPKLRTLAVIFVLCGMYVEAEETLEDSLCAELVAESQHGMAIETVATVNGIGDISSRIVVGFLGLSSALRWRSGRARSFSSAASGWSGACARPLNLPRESPSTIGCDGASLGSSPLLGEGLARVHQSEDCVLDGGRHPGPGVRDGLQV